MLCVSLYELGELVNTAHKKSQLKYFKYKTRNIYAIQINIMVANEKKFISNMRFK